MRDKRNVRASGVGRSLGAGPRNIEQCLGCGRRVPREAIAFISKTMKTGPLKGRHLAVCGECWRTAREEVDAMLGERGE